MPNLYFCQPHARNQGMLRAVLSIEECSRVIAPLSVTYVGDHFPSLTADPEAMRDFAVLSVAPDETNPDWRPGFYRSDSGLDKINQALLLLKR
jgi:hypothetical protein